ncbi:MAG: hypothetical protein HUJ68_08760 [Clostridia bacterium]|nr:hypothetical protein [Clostridia bacterium]
MSSCVNIKENEIIKYITVFDSKTVKSFSARIIEINSSDIKLKAINYYEEEI